MTTNNNDRAAMIERVKNASQYLGESWIHAQIADFVLEQVAAAERETEARIAGELRTIAKNESGWSDFGQAIEGYIDHLAKTC